MVQIKKKGNSVKKRQIRKIRPKTHSIDEISRDFSGEDWKEVENEKKYYELVAQFRELRQKIGLTQKELAEKAKLPRATIVKIESGKRNATLDTLMNMAQAMRKNLVISLE